MVDSLRGTGETMTDENRTRPSWEEYWIGMCYHVATRSSCIRRQIGAIIVRDNILISSGYNGTPRGIRNCDEGGCVRCNTPKEQIPSGAALDECVCIHAEENAILQAAHNGIMIKGGTMYTSLCPCIYCAKHIINCGITEVHYNEAYSMDDTSLRLFDEAGVNCVKFSPPAAPDC